MKRQWVKFPCDLYWENKTYKLKRFSLTWPASMQSYGNKRNCLLKKRDQLPQDWFGTPTWPPWRHVKPIFRRMAMWYWCPNFRSLRWLDTVFQGQYLPSLSINYVAIKKVLEKLPPQLYYIKMKICYDQGCNGIGVVIATKSRYYLFYLQQCISALRTVLQKSFTGAFSSNSSLDIREV